MAANSSITKLPQPMNPLNTKTNFHPLKSKSLKPCTLQNPSWLTSSSTQMTNLSFNFSIPRPHMPAARCPISATALFCLPTAFLQEPRKICFFYCESSHFRWTWRAIKAFTMAELEARKLKYANTGTEALLLGILIEGTSLASKYLWKNGITVFKVREEAIKLLGKADMYYFPPEQPPLTESAQRALDWAVDHKLNSGNSEEVTTTDLLLGIWLEVESPGHKILSNLGFNDVKAKELESQSSVPGFVDG